MNVGPEFIQYLLQYRHLICLISLLQVSTAQRSIVVQYILGFIGGAKARKGAVSATKSLRMKTLSGNNWKTNIQRIHKGKILNLFRVPEKKVRASRHRASWIHSLLDIGLHKKAWGMCVQYV